jgi:hypothetical protein
VRAPRSSEETSGMGDSFSVPPGFPVPPSNKKSPTFSPMSGKKPGVSVLKSSFRSYSGSRSAAAFAVADTRNHIALHRRLLSVKILSNNIIKVGNSQ